MKTAAKKTVTTSLPQAELAELDRVSERQHLTRAEAVREAVRWYVATMRRLPPAEDPAPDEIAAIQRGEAEFARGKCRGLEDVLHDLGRITK
jgi:metal-responsive CopG/Arc/MetJ family transcriptional regulator